LRDNGRNYRSKGTGQAFRASSLLLLGDSVVATADQVLWRQQKRAIPPYFNHVTRLITGYESSAANLSRTFHLLTEYPAIQKRLQAEVLAVLPVCLSFFD